MLLDPVAAATDDGPIDVPRDDDDQQVSRTPERPLVLALPPSLGEARRSGDDISLPSFAVFAGESR